MYSTQKVERLKQWSFPESWTTLAVTFSSNNFLWKHFRILHIFFARFLLFWITIVTSGFHACFVKVFESQFLYFQEKLTSPILLHVLFYVLVLKLCLCLFCIFYYSPLEGVRALSLECKIDQTELQIGRPSYNPTLIQEISPNPEFVCVNT